MPQRSRFIEHLDGAPPVRSPNTNMNLIWRPKAESQPSPETEPPSQAPPTAENLSATGLNHQSLQPLSHVFRDPGISNSQTPPAEDFLAPGDPLAPFLDEPEYPMGQTVRICGLPPLHRSNALHRPRRSRTPHPKTRGTASVAGPSVPLVARSKPPPGLCDESNDDIEPFSLGSPLVPVPVPQRYESPNTEESDYYDEVYYDEDEEDSNHPNEIIQHSRTGLVPAAEHESVRNSYPGCMQRIAITIFNTCSCFLGLVIPRKSRRPGM